MVHRLKINGDNDPIDHQIHWILFSFELKITLNQHLRPIFRPLINYIELLMFIINHRMIS
jgi:hypothetical protein